MRGPVGVDHRHFDAQRFQLFLNGYGRVGVVFRCVEPDFHLQRGFRRVAQPCQNFLRLVLTVQLRHVCVSHWRGYKICDARWHQRIGRNHRVLPDFFGQIIAVDRHGNSLSQFRIIPRRLVGFERIVIGAKIRPDLHLIPKLDLHIGQLFGREIVVHVQLTRFKPLDRGGAVFCRIKIHRVDLYIRRIIERGAFGQGDMIIRRKRGQGVRTVRHHIARLGEICAKLFHIGAADRISRLMRQHFQKIRRHGIQLHLKRARVNRLHAQFLGLFGACGNFLGVHDRGQHIGVFGRRFGADHTLPGKHEIIGSNR